MLSEKTGFPIFSASGHLKAFAQSHPVVGETLLYDMNNGILVPYWIMSYLWINEVVSISPEQGFIFDGSVRKIEEAKLFDEVMQYLKRSYVVIYLAISDEELHARLTRRAQIEGRADDDATAITKRLEEYKENTQGSLDFLKQKGTLVEIDGMGSVDEVQERIMKALA